MDATFKGPGGRDPVAEFRLLRFATTPTRADLLFGGNLLVAAIRDRTFAGTDVDGAAFAPYSPAYAKRKSGVLGHGRVDLFGADHHTHMLNALQTVVDGDATFGVGIYTNDELEARARVHNEGLTVRTRLGTGKGKPKKGGKSSFAMPKRHWLGASAAELDAIYDAIGDRTDERLKRLI
jgi:Phage virion morphogenesis family